MQTVAIAGNPNSGKTSVFNMLTGMTQHVANYPGVTVEVQEGAMRLGDTTVRVVDLPGTYSLSAYSADERVARDLIVNERPDLVVNVLDASNLERNLYLTAQLMEMGRSMVIVLNMQDVARRHGVIISEERLSRLLGVPVVSTQANHGIGADSLKEVCLKALNGQTPCTPKPVTYGHPIMSLVLRLADGIGRDKALADACAPRWLAARLLEQDPQAFELIERLATEPPVLRRLAQEAVSELTTHVREDAVTAMAEARYGFAAGAVRQCLTFSREARRTHTDMIDAVVCHRVAGPVILAAVVFLMFKLLFLVAQEARWVPWFHGRRFSPVGAFEHVFEWMGVQIEPMAGPHPVLFSVLHDAVIGGVGGVLGFMPLIFTMFVLVSVLEDSGYIARIAFIMDRVLKVFGLQGKSILALVVSGGLGGGGCAVPGVLATRTLREEKDRLITILVTPFMNCGAKLPVYAVLTAAFFPTRRENVMFALWLLSWAVTLVAAFLLSHTLFRGQHEPFVMELPTYHLPGPKAVLLHSGERTWMYVKKAGTVVLGVNMAMWLLMYFPHAPRPPAGERAGVHSAGAGAGAPTPLARSFAGRAGRAFEPVSRLAGFSWRENVALVAGFAAKELVIGTLGTAYSLGNLEPGGSRALSAKLATDPAWNRLRAFALMVFVMVYAPCLPTLLAIRRETRSLGWALFSTAYSTLAAFALAVGIYQVGQLLQLGT